MNSAGRIQGALVDLHTAWPQPNSLSPPSPQRWRLQSQDSGRPHSAENHQHQPCAQGTVRETKAQLEPPLLPGAQSGAGGPGPGSGQPRRQARAPLCAPGPSWQSSRLPASGTQGPAEDPICSAPPRATNVPFRSPKASSHHSPRVPALTLEGSAALPPWTACAPNFILRSGPGTSLPAWACTLLPTRPFQHFQSPQAPHCCP